MAKSTGFYVVVNGQYFEGFQTDSRRIVGTFSTTRVNGLRYTAEEEARKHLRLLREILGDTDHEENPISYKLIAHTYVDEETLLLDPFR